MIPTETGQAGSGFNRSGGLPGLEVAGSRPKLPALKGARDASETKILFVFMIWKIEVNFNLF